MGILLRFGRQGKIAIQGDWGNTRRVLKVNSEAEPPRHSAVFLTTLMAMQTPGT